MLACFFLFFLNQSPAGEEQQRKLLCPLFLWLDLLESSLFKESHSLSLGKEWPVETKVRQAAGERTASGGHPTQALVCAEGAAATRPAPPALLVITPPAPWAPPGWSPLQVPAAAGGHRARGAREGPSEWQPGLASLERGAGSKTSAIAWLGLPASSTSFFLKITFYQSLKPSRKTQGHQSGTWGLPNMTWKSGKPDVATALRLYDPDFEAPTVAVKSSNQ